MSYIPARAKSALLEWDGTAETLITSAQTIATGFDGLFDAGLGELVADAEDAWDAYRSARVQAPLVAPMVEAFAALKTAAAAL